MLNHNLHFKYEVLRSSVSYLSSCLLFKFMIKSVSQLLSSFLTLPWGFKVSFDSELKGRTFKRFEMFLNPSSSLLLLLWISFSIVASCPLLELSTEKNASASLLNHLHNIRLEFCNFSRLSTFLISVAFSSIIQSLYFAILQHISVFATIITGELPIVCISSRLVLLFFQFEFFLLHSSNSLQFLFRWPVFLQRKQCSPYCIALTSP